MTSELRAAFVRHPRDRGIAGLAIPALGTLALDPLVSIVDTAWVGRLGTVPLAALAIASAVFAAVFSIFNFVHMAITPLIAGEVGAGRLPRAGAIAKGAVVVTVAIGIVVGGLAIAFAPAIVGAFGAEPDVAAAATDYLRIRFLALPLMLIAMVGHGVYRGHSDTRTPLIVSLAMTVANLLLDPVLIFGFALGVAGAAWATVVAQSIAAAAFLVLMFRRQRTRLGTDAPMRGVRSLGIGRILDAGWPMMIRAMALLAAITATTVAASRIGTDEVAAHQIAMQVWLFLAFVLDSWAVAAQAMIGTDLGAGRVVDARGVANRLLALGLVTGVALSILLAATAPWIADLFAAEPDVADQLASIYWFVIILQPITALVYVWDGIGIGASAFRYLAGSMVVAGSATLAVLWLEGDTLVGVWFGLVTLTLVRMVALAWWDRAGPLAAGRAPSRASPAA